jgi:hypothetical protein
VSGPVDVLKVMDATRDVLAALVSSKTGAVLAFHDEARAAVAELIAVLRDASDYFHDIPESAVGGDDSAVALAKKLRAALAKVSQP